MSAIEIINVTKKFGNFVAVDNLSLTIPENKIFGLLGTNGAGKTTTINMLTGLLLPDSGMINILGMDSSKNIEKIRKNISLVPQTISLYDSLTIYENLDNFGGLYIEDNKELKSRIEYFINKFNLNTKKNVKIADLSGGYQRRCSIACSVISSPKILFLDEPSEGIDLHTNKIIMDFIKSIKDVTIILTTHSIKEAEALCDYIVFMDKGQKVLEGIPKEIVKEYSKHIGEVINISFDGSIDIKKIKFYLKRSNFNIKSITYYKNSVSFVTSDLGNSVIEAIDSLKSIRKHVVNIDINKPSLEDVFNMLMENKNENS